MQDQLIKVLYLFTHHISVSTNVHWRKGKQWERLPFYPGKDAALFNAVLQYQQF